MTVQGLETLAANLFENKNFLSLGLVIKDSRLDASTIDIRGPDFDRLAILDEKDSVEHYFCTFARLETVYKDLHSGLNFELLACNVNDCVHFIKLIKSFRP